MIQLTPFGDCAVSVRCVEVDAAAARSAAYRLARHLSSYKLHGVIDCSAAYEIVTVTYDPARVPTGENPFESVCGWISGSAKADLPASNLESRSVLDMPTCFSREFGMDLSSVASELHRSEADIIEQFCNCTLIAGAIGFLPGFAYLLGLPSNLQRPRRSRPRLRVAAGSVGIGGAQVGVYPVDSPGGWNILGRTPLRMFDPSRQPTSLIELGSRVRFRAITAREFSRWK